MVVKRSQVAERGLLMWYWRGLAAAAADEWSKHATPAKNDSTSFDNYFLLFNLHL